MDSNSGTSNGSYLRIADELRSEIDGGRFGTGSQLPTQAALVRRFGVSRSTVQRALDVLRTDGYIDSVRGRGSKVLHRTPLVPTVSAQPSYGVAAEMLGAHLGTAFEAEHVRIDAYSLTAETLSQAIGQELTRIHRRVISPQSIAIRVLLADPDTDLLIGPRVGNRGDERPRRRIAKLIRSHATTLESHFRAIADRNLVPAVSVDFRTLAATPVIKAYLLNGTELLHGYYQFQQREIPVEDERMSVVDALGVESMLFHHSAADAAEDPTSAALVQHTQDWFESLWQTVAEPLRLNG